MIGHKNNRTKGTNNASIPEDNEQYCFRMPLKLEVHKRYWTTHQSGRGEGEYHLPVNIQNPLIVKNDMQELASSIFVQLLVWLLKRGLIVFNA